MSDEPSAARERPDTAGRVILDGKTVAMALAFLAGGGLAGGGTALAGARVPTEMQEAMAETRVAVSDLGKQLGEVQRTLVEMRADRASSGREIERVRSDLADHERRLRELEHRR